MNSFGQRLAQLRKAKGMTQTQLGQMIGVSKRVICYYEKASKHPPAKRLHLIAKALNVSADQLLGIEEINKDISPSKNRRLLKRLELIDQLPLSDQKALIHYIDLLIVKQKSKKKK